MQAMRASDLFPGAEPGAGGPCALRAVHGSAGDGIEVYLVQLVGKEPVHVSVHNDSERVHFSYWLQGGAQGHMDGRSFRVGAGHAVVAYAPGRQFDMALMPGASNVEIVVRPSRLAELDGACAIVDEVARGNCLRDRLASAGGRQAAWRVAQMIAQGQCTGLLLQAVVYESLAWQLEAPEPARQTSTLPRREREALEAARERLLLDLAAAPSIAKLARDVGLNTLKLQRGFRTLFGTSVYGLYQQSRMNQARKLLDRHSVTDTALTLGYTNISHFSTAFRKEFGVLPSEFRRRV